MESPEFSARFRDPEQLARGGMGNITSALDSVIGRRVAIKTLHPELCEDERAAEQFAEEARITGQLEHPNVVPVYDLGGPSERPFMVMKLLQGRSLTQLLATQAPRGAETSELMRRLVEILLRLCDALSFAHDRGVFHCDVKPDNIMVGEHGQVYLMDWGVALSQHPQEGFGGTAAYMAPEQLQGRRDIDARTDVYGLGGVLYEILTGNPPNDASRLIAIVRGEVQRTFAPGPLWSELPPELCRIAEKALEPQRESRYPSVAELRADLEQFLKGGGWFGTRRFSAGQHIVSEGEPGNAAYLIQSGQCEVRRRIQGESLLIRQLGPGDVFGEAAVFTGGSRTATIVAVSDVTLRVVTGEALNRELDQNPTLAAFVRSLANLFRETDAALSAHGARLPSWRPPASGG